MAVAWVESMREHTASVPVQGCVLRLSKLGKVSPSAGLGLGFGHECQSLLGCICDLIAAPVASLQGR